MSKKDIKRWLDKIAEEEEELTHFRKDIDKNVRVLVKKVINAKKKVQDRPSAIKAFCLECHGGDSEGVKECDSCYCPLWLFRKGRDPFQKGRGK